MSKDKNWTQQVNIISIKEDQVLKQLKQDRGIKKWSIISKLLQEQFQTSVKSGKRCRERYQNHLNSHVRRDDWSLRDEERLFQLHNEKGNRWVQIAKELQRSDNAVKNHYHSKLRKALRKINKLLHDWLKNEFKPLKNNIISKIMQTAEEYHEQIQKDQPTNSKFCYNLKNQILKYLQVNNQLPTSKQLTELRTMVKEMNQFNKIYKKKSATKDNAKKQKIRCTKYKGKEILTLISENKKNKKIQTLSLVQADQKQFSITFQKDNKGYYKNQQASLNLPANHSQQYFNKINILSYQTNNYFNSCSQFNTFPIYSEYPSPSLIFFCQNPTYLFTGHHELLSAHPLLQQNQISNSLSVNLNSNSNLTSMQLLINANKQSNFQSLVKQ